MNSSIGSVITQVVDKGLCIGCGCCTATCPRGRLKIEWDTSGLLRACEAEEAEACPPNCSLCLSSCPFYSDNPDEDALSEALFSSETPIKKDHAVGYFAGCSLGQVNAIDSRLGSASGGLATWFLSKLMETGEVDYVLNVRKNASGPPYYEYTICSNSNELSGTSKSAYYPVTMSGVLQKIKEMESPFAVTCVPCFAKGLRLAAKSVPAIRNNLKYIAGIVCGHQVSSIYTDYLCKKVGKPPESLQSLVYRGKKPDVPAWNFNADMDFGDSNKDLYFSDIMQAWNDGWFTPKPCMYCDDLFAECADIVFMDAWLPPYSMDYKGTSIVVTRRNGLQLMIDNGVSTGELSIESISVEKVLESQINPWTNKTIGLAHRLWLDEKDRNWHPKKRVQASRDTKLFRRAKWEKCLQASQRGINIFNDTEDVSRFEEIMLQKTPVEKLEHLIYRVKSIPSRLRSRLGGIKRRLSGE